MDHECLTGASEYTVSTDLTHLLEDYIRIQPNRALGGVRALGGFEYQVRVYLADFGQALVSGVSPEDQGEHFANAMEALSDHTRQQDELTVCVQARSVLDRRTVWERKERPTASADGDPGQRGGASALAA